MHLQHMETSALPKSLPIPHLIHRGLCPHSDLSLRSSQKRLTSLCVVQLHLTFALVPCFEKKMFKWKWFSKEHWSHNEESPLTAEVSLLNGGKTKGRDRQHLWFTTAPWTASRLKASAIWWASEEKQLSRQMSPGHRGHNNLVKI